MKSIAITVINNVTNSRNIRRMFDIEKDKLVSNFTYYKEVINFMIPTQYYQNATDGDMFVIDWECISSEDFDTRTVVNSVTDANSVLCEILDIECKLTPDILLTGIEMDWRPTNRFFVLTGMSSSNDYEAVKCNMNYFLRTSESIKLKDKINNKYLVRLEKCYIPKTDLKSSTLCPGRKFYSSVDVTLLKDASSSFLINDGSVILTEYYKRVLENRKKELGITHREISDFTNKLLAAMNEGKNSTDYLVSYGYTEKEAEELVKKESDKVISLLLLQDDNLDAIQNIILNSSKVRMKYLDIVNDIYVKKNHERLDKIEQEFKEKEEILNRLNANIDAKKVQYDSFSKDLDDKKAKLDEEKNLILSYLENLPAKVSDYVINSELLKKFKTNINVEPIVGNCNTNPNVVIYGDNVDRKDIDKEYLLEILSTESKTLGIIPKYQKDIVDCVLDVIKLKMNFIVESSCALKFAKFLNTFCYNKKLNILYVDTSTTVTDLANLNLLNNELYLVYGVFEKLDIHLNQTISSLYPTSTFVFAIDDAKLLKLFPTTLWSNNFYFSYSFFATYNGYIVPTEDNQNYYKFNINQTTNSFNSDLFMDYFSIDIADKSVLKDNYYFVSNLIKKFNIVSSKTGNLNEFYVMQIMLILNSLGLTLENDVNFNGINDSLSSYVEKFLAHDN